jgi:sulfate transport system ATP-binding protein
MIPASQRKAGFAFQHYALFRHLNVFENIAFGLRVRPRATRPGEAEIRARVEKLLKLIQLEPLAKRFPSQLSGGQRQRISLARALAVEPKVLLLDEPFGALDAKVRKELRRWLRKLHDEIHVTTLFVTHDQEEALEVADRVAILRVGRVEQIGTPEEIYDNPASPFVYDFLGNVNLFSGRMRDGAVVIGDTKIEMPESAGESDSDAIAFVRPHDIRVSREPVGPATLAARVIRSNAAGPLANLELVRLDTGGQFTVQLGKEQFQQLQLKAGEQVFVELRNVKVFSDDYSI